MSLAQLTSQATSAPAPVTTAADAERLAAHFIELMDTLIGVVRKETDLVREGRLSEAAKLESIKGDLTRLYIADTRRLRASSKFLAEVAPGTIATVRQR